MKAWTRIPQPEHTLTLPQIAERYGVSQALPSIWSRRHSNFPAPRGRCGLRKRLMRYYDEAEIERWHRTPRPVQVKPRPAPDPLPARAPCCGNCQHSTLSNAPWGALRCKCAKESQRRFVFYRDAPCAEHRYWRYRRAEETAE